VGTLAVLVPIKGFGAAKARLGTALDAAERAALARRLAGGVLAAAAPLPTWVVCDDDDVAAFATAAGAGVIRQPTPGLNPGVQHAVAELAAAGHAVVLVAHADLPEPGGLGAVAAAAAADRVVLVADRHGEGTNVLAVPAAAGFRFAYGPGSAAAHRTEAARIGLPVHDVVDEGLGWDVDLPGDLDPAGWPGATSPGAPRSA
jgi:2-phospho-L-lactate guanylyltransferase